MKILIENIDIITCDYNSEDIIKNAFLGIEGGYISFISRTKNEEFKPDYVINGKNKILMPGLVNAHTHCAMTILRNCADDVSLHEWLFNNIFPAEAKMEPEDVYWGSLLGIAEMIKSGTTTFADMYLHMDEVARAVSDTGIRANLSKSPWKFDASKKRLANQMSDCFEYYKKWNNSANGRIKVSVEIHSVYLFDEESLCSSAQIAKELDARIHIHMLETLREREESIEKYGMSPVEICLKTGVLDVPVIAAHCVHLSKKDIEIIKEKGVNVVHNPSSNLKLGSGIARVPELLSKGINVSLGTDGAASNNNLNIIEEIHLTAMIHKGVNMDPTCINAYECLKMATVNSSKALGLEREIGYIKEGMKADVILFDMNKTHICPINNPISAIAYCVQGSDVDTVIIDGNIVMEKGQLTTIDEEKVKYEVKRISKKIFNL
ncbi:UNVERIFIED_CONTAM: 5-methylthioadenosine/S-adenosylhomocysteine deaminase [Acetivibrio alkalicellulosi]